MNEKQTSGFVWGITGNIVVSLLIALANILVGRFIPNSPREVLDVSSLVLPLLIIFLFLYRDKIRKVRVEPRLWFSQMRKLLTQAQLMEQNREFFSRFIGSVRQFVMQLFEINYQTKNLANYLDKAIKPSIIIVTVITVFLIVGFGVSIRWFFEQRTITTIPSIYNSYLQIYDFLAP